MGLDRADPRPPYRQIADTLRREIAEGRYQPGGRLPAARELAAEYGVAEGTVRSAISVLRSEKLVTSWQGKGVIVQDRAGQEPPAGPDAAAVMAALENLSGRFEDLEQRVEEIERRTAGAPPGPQGGPGGRSSA